MHYLCLRNNLRRRWKILFPAYLLFILLFTRGDAGTTQWSGTTRAILFLNYIIK